ncbi:MAG: hypothetical protein QW743_00680 [Candidatus Methanomethylicia archaeon]
MIATLISVYDKRNLEKILKQISRLGMEIIATSGTAKYIGELGYKAIETSEYTGFKEAPMGLIKTLHPKIYAGILLNPKIPEHREYMEKYGVKWIKMVIVNFYPFKEECIKGLEKAVENIDIGGVAMVRAAAKAALLYGETIVLTNPDQYDEVVSEIENYGWIEKKKIIKLAVEAFKKTCEYENEISKYLLEALK